MKTNLIKHIAVFTSGGDSPGMNAALYAIAKAAEKNLFPKSKDTMVNEDANIMGFDMQNQNGKKMLLNGVNGHKPVANPMLAQVVGVIIGSPEFQRK